MRKNEIIEADLKNGFTRIPNSILDALPQVGMNAAQHDICHILLRETYGWNRVERAISVGKIAQITGLSKRHISNELGELARRRIIVRFPRPGKTTSYRIQSDVSQWISNRKGETEKTQPTLSHQENRELHLVVDCRDEYAGEPGLMSNLNQRGEDSIWPDNSATDVEQSEISGVKETDRGAAKESSGGEANRSSGVDGGQAQSNWSWRTDLKKELKKRKDEVPGHIYTRDSIPYSLSYHLLDSIRDRLPDFMEPDIQAWCKTIDDMISHDKRDQVVITDIIDFALNDSFWQKVILSPHDLRKHFDRMNSIMHSQQNRDEARMIRERDEELDSYSSRTRSYSSRRSRDRDDWRYESDEFERYFE